MREYNAKYVTDAPDWEALDSAPIDVPYLDTPDSYQAYAQVAYDDQRLYVHLCKIEDSTLVTHNSELGMPCEDSCLEFFFCPMENDKRYFNIEFNLNGCVFFGFGSGVHDLLRLVTEGDKTRNLFDVTTQKTQDGWEVFYTVPYTLIKRVFPEFDIKTTKTMRANFFTCADNTVPPHYLSWSEVETDPFTFHNQSCFGKINFTK